MSEPQYSIKYVAIYLRKSRGDEDKDLEEHRQELIDVCIQNKWAYVEYAEVGTSDSIELRPKMKELLSDVEEGMYDAVLCIHLDRLSRGDGVDQATIQKTFARAEIVVVTPEKVYDYNNDQDMLMVDFQGMIARMEYKQISRRFRQGKARRAKLGLWSNGVPPYPYIRDLDSGRAVPVKERLVIYNYMKSKALEGYVSTDIAWELNSTGNLTPRGGLWQPAVVQRLLLDEVHLGHVVVGKKRKHHTTGEIKRLPKSEWKIYYNCHEPVKTQLEHDKLKFLYSRELKSPKASRAGKNIFSGLVRCGLCNSTLQFQKWNDRSTDTIKNCKHYDSFGVRCKNCGGSVNQLLDVVSQAIYDKRDELEAVIKNGLNSFEMNNLKEMLEMKLKEIRDHEKIIEKIYRNHEKNLYSKDEDRNDEIFKERRDKADQELNVLSEEYELIKKQLEVSLNAKNEDMLLSINEVIKIMNDKSVSVKDLNRGLKSILNSIIYTREDKFETPSVDVNFL